MKEELIILINLDEDKSLLSLGIKEDSTLHILAKPLYDNY